MKRPTHEADMMKLALSDSVAPKLAKKLMELEKQGIKDFTAAVIAVAAERDPEFWGNLADHVQLAEAVKNELLRLRRENKPVPRSLLKAVREASVRLGFELARSYHILCSGYAGINIVYGYNEKYIIVELLNERGRVVETFELPISEG
jgi:plasmid maintenance system antidote protein VapI